MPTSSGTNPNQLIARATASPNDPEAVGALADYYDKTGQYQPALALYQRYIALRPDDARAHVSVGELLLISGDVPNAENQFAQAIALNPAANVAAQAHLGLGNAYTALQPPRLTDALNEYRQASALDPSGDIGNNARSRAAAIQQQAGSGTVAPTALLTTPSPTLDPIHIRTDSAPASLPGAVPATIPVPTVTTGTVLQPLPGGQTFTTTDKKVTIRYPDNWDAQTAANAAQFTPKGASPTDPNVPRVTFNGLPIQLDLLSGDNAQSYLQTLASQTAGRGATALTVRSIDRVHLGSPSGLEAVRFIVSYTQGVPVVSEQVAVQPKGSDMTWFISATAPAADFATKWAPIIDGIAGSVTFL